MDEEKVYCSMYSRNAELYHHGIKGQKWGVRNGPPYPLGSDVSTGSRLKEKKNSSVIGGIKKSDNKTTLSRKERKQMRKELESKMSEISDRQFELLEKHNLLDASDVDSDGYDESKMKKFYETKDGKEYLKNEEEFDRLNKESWNLFLNNGSTSETIGSKQKIKKEELDRMQKNWDNYYVNKKKQFELYEELDELTTNLYKEYSKTDANKKNAKELESLFNKAPKELKESEDPDKIKEWLSETEDGRKFQNLQTLMVDEAGRFVKSNSRIKQLESEISDLESSIDDYENSEEYKKFIDMYLY